MKLVQIGARNYTCIAVKLDPIKKGETIEVDAQIGQHLLGQVYQDIAKNEHPYFVEAGDPRAAKYVTEEAPKPKPKRRARKKVAAKPAEPVTDVTEE